MVAYRNISYKPQLKWRRVIIQISHTILINYLCIKCKDKLNYFILLILMYISIFIFRLQTSLLSCICWFCCFNWDSDLYELCSREINILTYCVNLLPSYKPSKEKPIMFIYTLLTILLTKEILDTSPPISSKTTNKFCVGFNQERGTWYLRKIYIYIYIYTNSLDVSKNYVFCVNCDSNEMIFSVYGWLYVWN